MVIGVSKNLLLLVISVYMLPLMIEVLLDLSQLKPKMIRSSYVVNELSKRSFGR